MLYVTDWIYCTVISNRLIDCTVICEVPITVVVICEIPTYYIVICIIAQLYCHLWDTNRLYCDLWDINRFTVLCEISIDYTVISEISWPIDYTGICESSVIHQIWYWASMLLLPNHIWTPIVEPQHYRLDVKFVLTLLTLVSLEAIHCHWCCILRGRH